MRKLFAAFMACAVLAGCSKSDDGVDPTDDPIVFEGEKTTARITFSVSDSKAVTFPGNASLATERTIYNAVAVAFDKRGLLEATGEFDVFRDAGGVEPGVVEIEFDEITTGAHEFYVIANAPKSLLARKNELFPKGMRLSDFVKEIHTISSVSDIIRETTGIPSAQELDLETRGFLMTSESGETVILKSESELASAAQTTNSIQIKLVRAVAKVSVAYDPITNGEPEGTLKNVQYRVLNNPKSFYVFQNMDGTQLYTPFFSEDYNQNNYIGSAHGYKNAIVSTTGPDDKEYTYCIENANMAELQGNSTMVYIKGNFVPEASLLVDASGTNAGTLNADGDFWRIRETSTGIWKNEYYTEEPSSVDAGFQAVKFEKGLCYYHTWLKNEAADQYMVKRNSYVKLTITAVYSAGEPDEGGGVEPPKPIEESTTAVINVEVLDWDPDNQEATI